MTFSYKYDSPSATDKLRLLLGDCNPDSYVFHDEELTTFYALAGSDLNAAAAMACRVLAVDASKQAVVFSALSDSISIDKSKIPQYFIKLAEKLESGLYNEPIEGVMSIQGSVNWAGQNTYEMIDDDEISG